MTWMVSGKHWGVLLVLVTAAAPSFAQVPDTVSARNLVTRGDCRMLIQDGGSVAMTDHWTGEMLDCFVVEPGDIVEISVTVPGSGGRIFHGASFHGDSCEGEGGLSDAVCVVPEPRKSILLACGLVALAGLWAMRTRL